MLILFAAPLDALATTYWVSTTGGISATHGNCPTISGSSDPGTGNYMTPNGIVTATCAVAGDTIMFKAGTYNGSGPMFNSMVPNGTSASVISKVLCEGSRTCIIAYSNKADSVGVFSGQNVDYFQVGDVSNGFKVDAVNDSTSTGVGINLGLSSSCTSVHTTVSVIGNWVINHHSDGITHKENQEVGCYYTNLTVSYNRVDSPADPPFTSSGPPHAIYMKVRTGTVAYNGPLTPHNIAGTGSPSYAIQCYHICTNVTIYRNYGLIVGRGRGLVMADNETAIAMNNTVYYNVFKNSGVTATTCIDTASGGKTANIYNNTCDNFSLFFNGRSGTTGYVFKNNLCSGTCTITNGAGDLSCGGTCSTTNPTVTAATHYKDPSNGDYSLKAGSSQIDAGLIVGLAYNGSLPDRGAYETFGFSSCVVNAGATSTVRVTFSNNVAPPLLPASGALTFTVRKNGSNNVVSGSVTRVGDNIFDIPVTDSYAAGNTVDISWASGNITDSSLVGGSVSQPYLTALTNQSCTNNTAGVTYTFTQARFEIHELRGTESAPVMIPFGTASTGAAENYTGFQAGAGGKHRLRIALTCGGSGDCPDTAFSTYFSHNGGSYIQLMDTVGVDGVYFCGTGFENTPSNGAATTNQLSTSGTFTPGGVVFTQSAIPNVTGFLNGYKTEIEFCIAYTVGASGTFDFRMRKQDGSVLDSYTVTPRIEVVPASAGMGF